MICWSAKHRTADYADGTLRGTERSRLETHLKECASCSLRFEEIRSVRSALAELPEPATPADLRSALQVVASRERQAVVDHRGGSWKRVWDQWRFRFNEIMRPLTIPATGGVLSSLVLFGALAFTIEGTSQMVSYEVPVMYANHVDANLVPVQLRSAVMVTLSLDGNGRITDYSVRDGDASFVGDPSRLQANNISMPEFPSVLALAQPISGDVSILFRPIVFRQ